MPHPGKISQNLQDQDIRGESGKTLPKVNPAMCDQEESYTQALKSQSIQHSTRQ